MQNILSFDVLSAGVLGQLKSQGYKESTLTAYRRIFNRIQRFMESKGTSIYTEQVGEYFLSSTNVSKTTLRAYRCAVRRLNDFNHGRPYVFHVSEDNNRVPEVFKDVLDHFVLTCKASGNKPLTIEAKKHTCTLFLQFIETNGYDNLADLNTEIVSKGLTIYDNKDDYAHLRMFLKHLSDESVTKTDLSAIVPRYKRRKPLPTAYTPEDVIRIESSINVSTNTGLRDLAIVRLASRMGYRAGDIANLKWSEVNFTTGYISILQEKTGVPLSLPMPQDVIDALKAYAGVQSNKNGDDYVFHQMMAPYNRISTAIVRHAVSNAIAASGIDYSGKKHGPHALRSSLASSMVNDGAAYETVRRILGHTDPDIIKRF